MRSAGKRTQHHGVCAVATLTSRASTSLVLPPAGWPGPHLAPGHTPAGRLYCRWSAPRSSWAPQTRSMVWWERDVDARWRARCFTRARADVAGRRAPVPASRWRSSLPDALLVNGLATGLLGLVALVTYVGIYTAQAPHPPGTARRRAARRYASAPRVDDGDQVHGLAGLLLFGVLFLATAASTCGCLRSSARRTTPGPAFRSSACSSASARLNSRSAPSGRSVSSRPRYSSCPSGGWPLPPGRHGLGAVFQPSPCAGPAGKRGSTTCGPGGSFSTRCRICRCSSSPARRSHLSHAYFARTRGRVSPRRAEPEIALGLLALTALVLGLALYKPPAARSSRPRRYAGPVPLSSTRWRRLHERRDAGHRDCP